MSLEVRVEGGTNAGRRLPLRPTPEPWDCFCLLPTAIEGFVTTEPKRNPGYLVGCPDCGAVRPS